MPQTAAIKMTFILEKKLQKVDFFPKSDHFLSDLRVQFESLLTRECAYLCHDLRTKKEEIYVKRQEYETIDIQVTFMLEIKLHKYIF